MKYLILIFFIFITACAPIAKISYQDVINAYAKVNADDGVTQDEAVTIAQNFIIRKGLGDRVYSLVPVGIDKWIQWEKDGTYIRVEDPPSETFDHPLIHSWVVLFRDVEGSQLWGRYPVIPFYVEVDLKTGEVRSWGLYNDEKK